MPKAPKRLYSGNGVKGLTMSKLTVQAPPCDTNNTQKRQEENSGSPAVSARLSLCCFVFFRETSLCYVETLDLMVALGAEKCSLV
ncbi:MAG: hypothetical protein FWD44_03270 [Oscillospiraceae bacterium]|nr:hypothetical protein [Oscillospiraceae bacterium]